MFFFRFTWLVAWLNSLCSLPSLGCTTAFRVWFSWSLVTASAYVYRADLSRSRLVFFCSHNLYYIKDVGSIPAWSIFDAETLPWPFLDGRRDTSEDRRSETRIPEHFHACQHSLFRNRRPAQHRWGLPVQSLLVHFSLHPINSGQQQKQNSGKKIEIPVRLFHLHSIC